MLDNSQDRECETKLSNLSYQRKIEFIGYYEKIALLVQSNVIEKNLAFYFFAYYAIRCWQSNAFWKDLNRNGAYWRLFANYAQEMEETESSFTKHPNINQLIQNLHIDRRSNDWSLAKDTIKPITDAKKN